MRIAVVGATGLVGTVLLKVLQERNFPVTELIPVASEKSIGKSFMSLMHEEKLNTQQFGCSTRTYKLVQSISSHQPFF